jgi:YVTN family beta-propeller protein
MARDAVKLAGLCMVHGRHLPGDTERCLSAKITGLPLGRNAASLLDTGATQFGLGLAAARTSRRVSGVIVAFLAAVVVASLGSRRSLPGWSPRVAVCMTRTASRSMDLARAVNPARPRPGSAAHFHEIRALTWAPHSGKPKLPLSARNTAGMAHDHILRVATPATQPSQGLRLNHHLAGPDGLRDRKQETMRSIQRALIPTAIAMAALTPAATTTTAASASLVRVTAHGTASCSVAATVGVGSDPRGVAVDLKTNTIYVANLLSGTLSLISGRTSKVTATIPAGTFPFGIAADPKTKRIYVTDLTGGEQGQLVVISARTQKLVATVPVGSLPLYVAANPKTNTIYVSNLEDNTVSVISGKTNTVTATIPVGFEPNGIAANPKTNTIYVANSSDNTVSVINGRTNSVTATIPVGLGPGGVAPDPKTNTIYATNLNDNTVSVINGRTNTVTATIPVGLGPFGVAADPKTNTIYVANAFNNTVSVISGQANAVTATIGVGTSPNEVAVNQKTNTAYVTEPLRNTVSAVSCRR